MSNSNKLRELIESGFKNIGELLFQSDDLIGRFQLCHHLDAERVKQPEFGGLEIHKGPASAREISTYAVDGTYRFSKAQTNLKRGWLMILETEQELQQALDQFYPAALGLFLAHKDGTLETQNLRDKLNRQTGMYRYARTISDEGAQKLVQSFCGPAHQCAKRILWQLHEHTPLADSAASRYDGIPTETTPEQSIPLLCREACNHLVAECRKAAKAESTTKPSH